MNPFLGRNFEALDPLEWLARLADHIPKTGKHRRHFYAYYANRVRGQRPPEELDSPADQDEASKKRWIRSSPTRCGQRMSIVAFVTDSFAIRGDHFGLPPPRLEKREALARPQLVAPLGRGDGEE
jgi:hypothetical protein